MVRCLFICLVFLVGVSNSNASPLTTGELSHSKYEIHIEEPLTGKPQKTWLAVRIEPIDGWHTYWKNPGDSGSAPYFGWRLPAGIEIGTPIYEVPERLPVGPLMNFGYHVASALLFPISFDEAVQDTVAIEATAEWLVCEVECVPQVVEISFDINPNQQGSSENSVFSSARGKHPEPSYWDASLTVSNTSSQLLVFADQADLSDITELYFFPEEEGVLTYAAEQSWKWTEYGLELSFERKSGAPQPSTANGLLKVMATDGSSQTYELEPELTINIRGTALPTTQKAQFDLPIWQASLFALIGGLILNLMPCVFPVLSLKAFALISANYKSSANRRKEGWAYTLGIWASFMLIVGVLVALRASGSAIGWGFQLQEPLFIAFLILLMVIVSLSLAGVFELRLGIEGAGQSYTEREGLTGAFSKGVLATLVATPCTAPLMAPAIGFALTQPLLTVFWVFSMLALGLALPFLALTYSDTLASKMPRPGAWMEKLKQGLAFPMLLTAAWLLYIYNLQAGNLPALFLLMAVIVVSFAVWLWQQSQAKVIKLISGLAFIVALIVSFKVSETQTAHESANIEGTELAYSEQALANQLSEGQAVFLYFTAEWCITCKVNEQVALFTDEVQAFIKAEDIQMMKGDWTNRNGEIAAVLADYGRAGVPLYLYFPKGEKTAVVLPELLTTDLVLEYLNRS